MPPVFTGGSVPSIRAFVCHPLGRVAQQEQLGNVLALPHNTQIEFQSSEPISFDGVPSTPRVDDNASGREVMLEVVRATTETTVQQSFTWTE